MNKIFEHFLIDILNNRFNNTTIQTCKINKHKGVKCLKGRKKIMRSHRKRELYF